VNRSPLADQPRLHGAHAPKGPVGAVALNLSSCHLSFPAPDGGALNVLDGLSISVERGEFAESDEERLRYSIDKNWYGELPRTYYYDTSHQVKTLSGSPDLIWLKTWASKF